MRDRSAKPTFCICGHQKRVHDREDDMACYYSDGDRLVCECVRFSARVPQTVAPLPSPSTVTTQASLEKIPFAALTIRGGEVALYDFNTSSAWRQRKMRAPITPSLRHVKYPRATSTRLSDEQIIEIRRLHAETNLRVATPYVTLTEIGARYGLSSAHVSLIVRGKVRRSAGGPMRDSWVD